MPVLSASSTLTTRFWIKMIALAAAVACGLALAIAALGAVGGAIAQEPESGQPRPPSAIQLHTFEGIITDSQCGARHSAALGKTAADCTLACVRGGGQFVLVAGDTVYWLEGDPVVLKRAAGQRGRISGTLHGEKISVTAVVTT